MIKKLLTGFLAAVMIFGSLSTSAFAAETTGTKKISKKDIDPKTMTFDEIYETKLKDDIGTPKINYMSEQYILPEDKLKDMVMLYEQYGYQLWYEYYTGEVALKDTRTGQVLFTNPIDINGPDSKASAIVKGQLLSQISLTYMKNGTSSTMYSFKEAAQKQQIRLKNIKDGIRVEYTLGTEATTRLIPMLIEKSRFERLILDKITDESLKVRLSGEGFYTLYDIKEPGLSEAKIRGLIKSWPALERMACYVYDPEAGDGEKKRCEQIIKNYAPEYTYDELQYDHDYTGYVNENESLPFFKLALEYTLNEEGVEVRVPANGIRFDESVFQLTSLSILPYFGAGSTVFDGYTFIPDGSGTIIRFSDIEGSYNISGEMYGPDFSYHEIVGQHAEIMRYPVYGVIANTVTGETQGYAAIITEGDSMAKIMSSHGGGMHLYNSVYPTFNPRPSDTYELTSSGVTAGASWTVTSSRRYTDSYRIKYVMLTDPNLAEKAKLENSYEPSYMGMAEAYRNHLEKSGQLTRLTADDVSKDLPLYVEALGSTKTDGTFLSIPITVDTPLTTFEDVKTMYDELSEAGISEVNFKLSGFTTGGLYHSTVPYKLSWERACGGEKGFEDLVSYSKEKNFGLYPDFEFAYTHRDTTFDGFSMKKHAVKTIDNRYSHKSFYDPAYQMWYSYLESYLLISPSVYDYLYEGLNSTYSKYGVNGISASSLGSDLNSDFDEDEPYNREDSKKFTQEILEKMSNDYDVMISGGNAYTFKYADVILDMATESSKYVRATATVPFIGMVLHGYIQTAGGAFNTEGDVESAVLHAIESGSSLYYVLAYRNFEALKGSEDYFSIDFEVWKEDIIKHYNKLNDATASLQTKKIVDHEFITGSRIPDPDEIEADAEQAKLLAEIAAAEKSEADRKALLESLLNKRRQELGMTVGDKPVEVPDDDDEDEDTENTSGSDSPDYSAGLTNKYVTAEGSVVRVEYEGNVSFILNYNSFAINAVYEGNVYEIAPLDFVQIKG